MTNTNKKTSLEMIPDLAVQLGVVSIHDLKAYTTYELITLLARRINEMIQNINQFESDSIDALKAMAQELDDLLRGDKVESEINKTLIEWKDSGVFDHLIQGSVFTDFENRLTSNTEAVEEMTTKVDEAVQELTDTVNNFNNYDFGQYPIFHKTLYGKETSVMQGFAKFEDGTYLFSQKNAKGAPSEGESCTITLLDKNGNQLSSMRVYHGGHGLMYANKVGNRIDIYMTADVTKNYALYKTTYQENAIVDLSQSSGYVVLPSYSNEKQYATIDFKNDKLMLVSRDERTLEYYKADIYTLSAYENGTQRTPEKTILNIFPQNTVFQGIGLNGNIAIFYHGAIGDKMGLRVFDTNTNTFKDYNYDNLGYTHNKDIKTVVEGEGLYIDNDGNILIGVCTGAEATVRANHIYVFANLKQESKFISETLEGSQTHKIYEGSGQAKYHHITSGRLSDLTEPGVYYYQATDFAKFTDIPDVYSEKNSGWYVEVSAKSKDRGVYQTLTRFTSGTNPYRVMRQIADDGSVGEWKAMTPERRTLWSKDSRTLTQLDLSDSIANYDFLLIRLWHEGGKYTTEMIQVPQIVSDKKIHFHGFNINDSEGSLPVYIFEMEVTVSEDLQTLTQTRKSRIKIENGVHTRTENSAIGIHNIQGIRGFNAL